MWRVAYAVMFPRDPLVDRETDSPRVTVDGPLAAQPFGACVRKALEDAIAEGYVSPDLTLFDEPYPLTFPVE
jgi:hypothetical protein